MAETLIKKFTEISKTDTEIAGGKGASLGEMTQAGIPSPEGFVILSNAFDKFLEETDLNVEIEAVLGAVDIKKVHTVENASEKIQAMILLKEMPEDIKTEILNFYKNLDCKFVAVRSSATSEDSASAAWAGQLDSFLNTTEETLLENVKKCWASLFTPRAIFYRIEQKLDKNKISVAVVVQKMIDSEESGVVFSVHPVTQDENQIIIEAGFGLGEAIVSGSITPDSYVVDKQEFSILDININKQIKALYKKAKGGNEWKTLREKGKKQVLTEKEVIELSKLIVKIENHYGFPCDIEWAKEKNHFYILQSRPITTIHNVSPANRKILDYIKSQKWFFGARADESLLFFSAKTGGYKFIEQNYGMRFAETLLIPLRKNYPIRVFNLLQAKRFHSVSNKRILKDPKILLNYVKKDDVVYRKIEAEGKNLILMLKNDDYEEGVKSFNKILSLYEIASAHFIIIFSLGLKLAENIHNLNDIEKIVKAHDTWRNSVAFKEEAMGENLFHFFTYLISKKKINFDPLLLMQFLTLNEVKDWLQNKLTDEAIQRKIRLRKKQKFVYLNLKNNKQEIIDDLNEIREIQQYFIELDKESRKTKSRNEISGKVAYSSENVIKGRVIIIKDKAELKTKSHLINGKVLVAIQTTPHFIPYMKTAKAIITDEGGLTCHAAIVSRELELPCIIGTGNATSILKDGDLVVINTNKGVIKILKSKKSK